MKSFFKRTPENEIVVQYHITTKEKDLSKLGLLQKGDWFLRTYIVLPVEFNPYLPAWKVFQYKLNKTENIFSNGSNYVGSSMYDCSKPKIGCLS